MAEEPLLELAQTIADGRSVDWQRVQQAANTDRERQLLAELRVLRQIAEVHADASLGPPPSSDNQPTPEYWGPLRLLTKIGHGTFGDVYRAWDPRLEREVALKILRPTSAATTSVATLPDSAVIDEGRMMARVKHPGVVVVYGADHFDDRVGVWMELVSGRTLAEEVESTGPFGARVVLEIGIAISEALAAVHRAGLIHRDVKAQNVMREPGGRIVVMDFGTGVEFKDIAEVESLTGTPLYLAPEVISGGAASMASDVYSMGVLLFHLATGAFPVQARTLREVKAANSRGERRSAANAAPHLPRALTRVIDRALSASAADRFQSATDLAAALHQVRRAATRKRAMAFALPVVTLTAAALWLWVKDRPGAPAGVSWTKLPQDLVNVFNVRGPSVDGRWVPCTSPWGSRNVALCNLVDGSVRVLRTPSNPTEAQPAGRSLLSEDGRSLAYVWYSGEKPQRASLRIIDLRSTADREVYHTTDRDLALERWTSSGLLLREAAETQEHRSLLVAAGSARVLAPLHPSDQFTDLSPDGRTLVVQRHITPTNSDLIAVDIASGNEAWRHETPTIESTPLWFDDGRAIAFVGHPSGCSTIQKLAIPNGAPAAGAAVSLHEVGPLESMLVGFNGDGSLLVKVTERFRTAFEAAVDLPRGTVAPPRPLKMACSEVTLGPDWSPDGKSIGLIAGEAADRSTTHLRILSESGRTNAEHAVPGQYIGEGGARWSPDGDSLAVATHRNEFGLLSVINATNGQSREILQASRSGMRFRNPRWTADGKYLYYLQGGIRRVRIADSFDEPVYPRIESEGRIHSLAGFDLANDGSLLLGMGSPPRGCTVRVVSPGMTARDRHTFDAYCLAMIWTRDASRILIATQTGRTVSLWLMDRETGAPTRLNLSATFFWNLSLSPDERRLAFTAGNRIPGWAMLSGIR